MGAMRRLLLAAFGVAALAALALLGPSWLERTRASRAPSRAPDRTGGRTADRAATPDATGGARGTGAEASPARVRGIVTGPMGVLWGARVAAYRAGSDDVLAETHTDPEGTYAMELEPDTAFDLAIEPSDLTGLLPWRREGVMLRSGEQMEEQVALGAGAVVRGRLVDEHGDPVGGIALRALAEDGATAASARTGAEGAFVLRGLGSGRYVLETLDPSWVFPAPVSVRADGRDVDLVVVPGVRIDLVVKDIETGEPVPAFTVRASSGELLILEAEGRDGALSAFAPWPVKRPRRERWEAPPAVSLDIAAPGLRRLGSPPGAARNVAWMGPLREPNTTIRVSFEGGDPYVGELLVSIKSKTSSAAVFVPFERDRERGLFRGALPWGDWEVGIIPPGTYRTDGYPAEARAGPGLDASIPVTLPGGGTIVFTPPAGADRTTAYLKQVLEESEELGDGRSMRVIRQGAERFFGVPREGTRVQGVPPGVYQIGVPRRVEIVPGRFVTMAVWIREVTIDADSHEEIQLPE
jgi:hypothetical protein